MRKKTQYGVLMILYNRLLPRYHQSHTITSGCGFSYLDLLPCGKLAVFGFWEEIGFHTSVENGVPTCGYNPKFPQGLSKTQSFFGTEKSLVYYLRHKCRRESA